MCYQAHVPSPREFHSLLKNFTHHNICLCMILMLLLLANKGISLISAFLEVNFLLLKKDYYLIFTFLKTKTLFAHICQHKNTQ